MKKINKSNTKKSHIYSNDRFQTYNENQTWACDTRPAFLINHSHYETKIKKKKHYTHIWNGDREIRIIKVFFYNIIKK